MPRATGSSESSGAPTDGGCGVRDMSRPAFRQRPEPAHPGRAESSDGETNHGGREMNFHRQSVSWVALSLALIGASFGGMPSLHGQRAYQQQVEPQLLRLYLRNTYDPLAEPAPWFQVYEYLPITSLGVYLEGWHESVNYQSGLSSTYDHLFLGPEIVGGLRGSV